jgi:hypothetical protein
MSADREAWNNLAQAAQWIADGLKVQWKRRGRKGEWNDLLSFQSALSVEWEYRLKPAPPKPREWTLSGDRRVAPSIHGPLLEDGESVLVREVVSGHVKATRPKDGERVLWWNEAQGAWKPAYWFEADGVFCDYPNGVSALIGGIWVPMPPAPKDSL